MGKPRTPIGTFGAIGFRTRPSGKVEARTRYRDFDGTARMVQASAGTRSAAEQALKAKLADRLMVHPQATSLTADSPFSELVEYWLGDLELEGHLAISTRQTYERNMRNLVLPGFAQLTLREIGVARCDTFIKQLSGRSYNRARQARVVLRLALGLAVRHEILPRNPMDHIAQLRRPPSTPTALTAAEVNAVRAAIRYWEQGLSPSGSGLTSSEADTVLTSDAFGPLTAELRRAEAHHHHPDTLLPQLVAASPLIGDDDIAAVLHHRVATAMSRRTGTSRSRPAPQLIAGLIPEATGPMTPGMLAALDERKHLIKQRARSLTQDAITNRAVWLRQLGSPPADPRRRQVWARHIRTVAAYRDLYQITADTPLGASLPVEARRIDAVRARFAMTQAQRLATSDRVESPVQIFRPGSRSAGPTL